mgnify:FL=1
MNIQLLTAATATNGYATGSMTTVAKANLVDTETFTLHDGVASYVFEFDVAGNGVTGGRTAVDVSLDTTADQVRDRVITAINGTAILITASSGGAATVSLVNDRFGSVGNTTSAETVADAGFALTDMTGGVAGVRLRDTTAARELAGDRGRVVIKSTAGSGTLTATFRLWGKADAVGIWCPLGTGTDANKGKLNAAVACGETSADVIAHSEVVEGLECVDSMALEITAIGGTATAVSAWLVARR